MKDKICEIKNTKYIRENITPIGDGNIIAIAAINLKRYTNKREYNSDRRRKYVLTRCMRSWGRIRENITPIGDGNKIIYTCSTLFAHD